MLVLSLNIQDIGTDGIRRSSNFTQEEFEEKAKLEAEPRRVPAINR
jgi:hypothetical protein